jgi:hypothetical protein
MYINQAFMDGRSPIELKQRISVADETAIFSECRRHM